MEITVEGLRVKLRGVSDEGKVGDQRGPRTENERQIDDSNP